MRKLVLAAALAIALVGAVGCKCSVPLASFDQVESTQQIIEKEYLKYVEADPKLSAKDKEDRKKLLESNDRNFAAIKDAHKKN